MTRFSSRCRIMTACIDTITVKWRVWQMIKRRYEGWYQFPQQGTSYVLWKWFVMRHDKALCVQMALSFYSITDAKISQASSWNFNRHAYHFVTRFTALRIDYFFLSFQWLSRLSVETMHLYRLHYKRRHPQKSSVCFLTLDFNAVTSHKQVLKAINRIQVFAVMWVGLQTILGSTCSVLRLVHMQRHDTSSTR
jgi:hypothetical protein